MKADEFRLIAKRYQKHYVWLVIPFFALILLGIPCSIGIFQVLRTIINSDNSFVKEIIPIIAVVLFFIAFFFFTANISEAIGGNIGYNCPNCRRQLAHLTEKIIPNGYCPYCGKKVLDIEPPPGFHCPYCGHREKNFEDDIIATGNCPHCGRQVINLEP